MGLHKNNVSRPEPWGGRGGVHRVSHVHVSPQRLYLPPGQATYDHCPADDPSYDGGSTFSQKWFLNGGAP